MKKFVSLFLTLALCMSMTVTTFAADASEIPDVEKTSITYELPAPENDDDDGIQPLIWGQETHEPIAKVRYTTQFIIPDRYFAYEISATSGNPSGDYAVALMDQYTTVVRNISTVANGSTRKADWITVDAGEKHQFRISNLTGSNLKVTITYYSWK